MKTSRSLLVLSLVLLPFVTVACSGGAPSASAESAPAAVVTDEDGAPVMEGGSCCGTQDACCAEEGAEGAEEAPGCCK